MPLLEVSDLHAHYGKSHILNGVSLAVGAKEIVAVLGRNGSGRSTLMKAIIGLVPPTGGSIRLDGAEIAGAPAYQIVRRGLAYVPEERLAFDNLTVEENLLIGLQKGPQGAPAWTIADMYNYFPPLLERRATRAGKLSGGEQQLLTLCRSLLCHPKAILIDEPTEGLAPKLVESLVEIMRDMARRGVAIVLVEQKMTIALRIADRCLVMGHGKIVFEGTPDELSRNTEVKRSWLEAA